MQAVAFFQHLEHFQTGADNARCKRVGEEVRTTALAQHVDDFLAASGESSECAAKGFAQRSRVDVHAAVGVFQLTHAVTGGTNHACRVALVYHHQSIILLCQVANLIHRCHVAIHREHAVGADDAETLCLCFFQAFLQFGHVAVGIAVTLGLAQPNAVDDGCVVERIGNDSVFVGEQCTEQSAVGVKARCVENGVLGLEILADGGFQLFVNVLCSTDKTNGRHAEPAAVHHLLGRLNQARMVGKSQIVVGTEVQHFFPFHHNGCVLRTLNDSFLFVKTCFS